MPARMRQNLAQGGIIFLMPDAAGVKKILGLANTDGMSAIELIKACSLYGYASSTDGLIGRKFQSKANRFVEFDKSCGVNGGGKVSDLKVPFHPIRDGDRLAIFALSGPIPSELSNLINLTSLYLYSNQLTGPIPPALFSLDAPAEGATILFMIFDAVIDVLPRILIEIPEPGLPD